MLLYCYPMTIADARKKCKSLIARIPRDVLSIAILILASSCSFGLGYLAGQEHHFSTSTTLQKEVQGTGQVVASKNGTKYYLSGCAGADRISDANKVWFASPAAAAAAGYTPAANCEGV